MLKFWQLNCKNKGSLSGIEHKWFFYAKSLFWELYFQSDTRPRATHLDTHHCDRDSLTKVRLTFFFPQASCGVRDPVRGLGVGRLHRLLLDGEQREQAGAGPGPGSPDGLLHQLDPAVAGRSVSLRTALLEVQQSLR